MVDSHCHLDDRKFDPDRDAVIGRALEAGVELMMAVGTGDGPPDLEAALRLADRYEALRATAGVHPHDAAKADDRTLGRIEELLKHPKVLALGEIGLDFHYDFSPRDRQRALFAEQLELAGRTRTPVVIHTREAWEETFAILETHWNPAAGGVMHCFTGGPAEARRSLDMGFHLSFGGIVTFPNAAGIREAVRLTPLKRLLIETDAPYLAPVPHRGKRNEPAFAVHTAAKVAELLGVDRKEVERSTTENFAALLERGRL